jgi:hypothetical protein
MLAGAFLQLHNQHMSRLLLFAQISSKFTGQPHLWVAVERPFHLAFGATPSQVSNIISAFLW